MVIVGKKDRERFRKFTAGEDKNGIKSIEALSGVERVWALQNRLTPNTIWSIIHSGDRVFFACYEEQFSHLGTVSGTLVDMSVATHLWGDAPQVRQLDRLVLFSSVQKISYGFRKICGLAGINPRESTTIYVAENRIPVSPESVPQPSGMGTGVVVLEGDSVGIVTLESDVTGTPQTVTEAVTRFLRDTKKVKQLKSKYNGKCQICEYVLQRPDGSLYSEVHHLHPLKDVGDDDFANMLNLCARHHVEFDYLAIGILEDHRTVVDRHGNRVGTITFGTSHKLDRKNIRFHLERMEIK